MSDHHVDAMDINYSAAAKDILQRHGLYIHGAPDINHKPGNDFISDVYYPFPIYPDNRFRDPYEDNKDIQEPPKPEEPEKTLRNDFGKDFQIVPEEIKHFKNRMNPIITFSGVDRETKFDNTVCPYTGLVLQALEKKAFDVSFVKPYIKKGERINRQHVVEMITGHFYSIATYDGWKYHIYRGLCRDIIKSKSSNWRDKIRVRTTPFGKPIEEVSGYNRNITDKKKVTEDNLHIVLDCSQDLEAEICSIPINQIIDIEEYNFIYDFTIYEGDLKIYWDDWMTVPDKRNDGTFFTYVPFGDIHPQTLYHEVIEHQKPRKFEDRP